MNKDTYNFIRWINKYSPDKKFFSWFQYYYDEETDYTTILDDICNYENVKNIKIDNFDENGITIKKDENTKTIFFDLDGTLYDLYNYDGWMDCILCENTECYLKSSLLLDKNELIEVINELKRRNYIFGIISWLSRNATKEYQKKVRNAKYQYLKKHFPNVFDEIHIIQYGKNKSVYCKGKNTILFDDEEKNRFEWIEKNGLAYNEKNIIDILKSL